MNDKSNEMGGPAYPIADSSDELRSGFVSHSVIEGATLWDYYAAAALACVDFLGGRDIDEAPIAAGEAADIADAMLSERRRRFGGEG